MSHVGYIKACRRDVEKYLKHHPGNQNGLSTRHASYRAIRTFYGWLESNYGLPIPTSTLPAPILSAVIMPSLTLNRVKSPDGLAGSRSDKAIHALFVESGLGLSELATISRDINWDEATIKVYERAGPSQPWGRLN